MSAYNKLDVWNMTCPSSEMNYDYEIPMFKGRDKVVDDEGNEIDTKASRHAAEVLQSKIRILEDLQCTSKDPNRIRIINSFFSLRVIIVI